MSQDRPTVAVVGGGITGLVAARALARGGAHVVLFESQELLGGKIRTDELEGRPVEAGPDSFVEREPFGARLLCEELGLGDELVAPAAFGAHVWTGGKLRAMPAGFVLGVPASPVALLRSGILSPLGAGRALGDLVLPGPLAGGDVSVGSFVRRRFGPEVLERLVDPILAGTRAGRADDMSLAAAAPQIDSVARAHRSVLIGLMRGRRTGDPGSGAPKFLGLRAGMQSLVERLRADLGPSVELRTGAMVTRLSVDGADAGVGAGGNSSGLDRGESGAGLDTGGNGAGVGLGVPGGGLGSRGRDLVVESEGEPPFAVAGAVLAVPVFAATEILASICPDAARELDAIEYASVALVNLVYPPGAATLPPSGSGILVPSSEGRMLAGCTWTSRKWPHAAPSDGALTVRCFIGRSGDDAALELGDDELAARAHGELCEAMGIGAPPRATKVVRWARAIPQYSVGHNERMDRIDAALAPRPTIALAGAGYRGSGLPDCIRQGEEAARRVLDALPGALAGARG
ncbi:hypothetical protein BH24ACT26_BH24ACT26_01860 [soil metagenome]